MVGREDDGVRDLQVEEVCSDGMSLLVPLLVSSSGPWGSRRPPEVPSEERDTCRGRRCGWGGWVVGVEVDGGRRWCAAVHEGVGGGVLEAEVVKGRVGLVGDDVGGCVNRRRPEDGRSS